MKINMKIDIAKSILLCFATIIMFIGNLMSARVLIDYREIENLWFPVLVFTFVFMFFVFRFNTNIVKQKLLFVLIWEIFILSIFVSKAIYGEFLVLEFILYSVFIPITFFSALINKYKVTLLVSYLISTIPFFYVLDANNNIGMLLAYGGIVLLMVLRIKKVSHKYMYIFIVIIAIILFITNSRTSLVAFLIVAAIQILSMMLRKNNSFFDIMRKGLLIITSGFLIYGFTNEINNLLFNKTINTSRDISSGRFEIWTDIIQNKVKIFGSEIDYFLNYNARDAHNIFIQVLGDYGAISFILLIIISLFIMYKSIKSAKLEYILFFTGYFLIGFTENIFFIDNRLISMHIVFFVVLGCLLNEKNSMKITKSKKQLLKVK